MCSILRRLEQLFCADRHPIPTHWLSVKCKSVKSLPPPEDEQSDVQTVAQPQDESVQPHPTDASMGTGVVVEVTFGGKTERLKASREENGESEFTLPAYFVMDQEAAVPLSFRISFSVTQRGRDCGQARLRFRGQGETLIEPLRFGDRETDTKIEVCCKLENTADALQVVRESNNFSLAEVVTAITDILKNPKGMDLLKEAMLRELRPRDPTSAQRAIQELLPEVLNYMPGLERDSCDEETIKSMKNISRAILELTERYRRKDNWDVVELAVGCFKRFLANLPHVEKASLNFNEHRFRRLLCAAQVQVRNLEPANRKTSAPIRFKNKWGHEIERKPPEDLMWEGIKSFSLRDLKHDACLARGAYGQVWLAIDSHTGKMYAVKTVLPNRDGYQQHEEMIANNEVKLLRQLMEQAPHPCIVDYYHVEGHSDPPLSAEQASLPQICMRTIFVHVMEYCSGGDIYSRVAASRTSDREYIVPSLSPKWIGQIFLALEYLHLVLHIMHRDLKPENIVLNEHGVAKLTDFGRSSAGGFHDGRFTYGFAPGNYYYTAPEVYAEQPYDSRADLYSFGALMWFILTGGIFSPDPRRRPRQRNRSSAPLGYYIVPNDGDFFQNCRAMQECLADPARYEARDLPCQASKKLVQMLTQRDENRRPFHEDIRNHPYIRKLDLPPRSASFDVVSSWASDEGLALSMVSQDDTELFQISSATNVSPEDVERVQHEWAPFQEWLASITNERRMNTYSIHISSVDKMGVNIRSVMLKVYGIGANRVDTVVLGGGSAAILVVLQHPLIAQEEISFGDYQSGNFDYQGTDTFLTKEGQIITGEDLADLAGDALERVFAIKLKKDQKSTIVVRQPRVAVCSTTIAEIPSGKFDRDGNFIDDGSSAEKIVGMLRQSNLHIHRSDLVDMTALSTREQYPGVYPSSDTFDAFSQIFLYQKVVSAEEFDDLSEALQSTVDNGDAVADLQILPLDELWRRTPDAKALAAYCLYKKLRIEQCNPALTPEELTQSINDTMRH